MGNLSVLTQIIEAPYVESQRFIIEEANSMMP